MADNAQKTPLVVNLNRFTDDKITAAQQLLGKALPASVVSIDGTGTIVTVKFEIESDLFTLPNVTCPLFGPAYIRYPLRAGGDNPTKGYVIPGDFYLGAMSGLGSGNATFDQRPNLSNLVFFPFGNSGLSPTPDADKTVVYGPAGVLVMTEDEETSMELGYAKGGTMFDAPLGKNILGARLIEAIDDADAKDKGIPKDGFYYDPDGYVRIQRIPD